jgi:phospholipid/cholesterol/gamma-HCH transport system substrate-binding protein
MRFRFDMVTLAKVAAFTLVAMLMTVILGMKIANVGFFGATYELEAVFSDATGVFKGDSVKVAGVDVGRVKERRIEDGKAVITFSVDDEVPLTTTSRVGIRWRNVIGLRFIYLMPSEGGDPLTDGARVPDSLTDEAGDIGEFLNRLGPILRAIDPDKANAFIEAMNTALIGNETIVRSLFSQGSFLATQLGSMDEQIASLIDSSDEIMAAYASQDDALGEIVDDLDTLGGELGGMTTDINLLVENFAALQEQMAGLLIENRSNIDATIAGLRDVTRNIATRRKDLSKTLCTLPAGVAPYDMTSSWGEWFNVRIVEFTLKDNNSDVVSRERETADETGKVTPPFTCSPEDRRGRAPTTAAASAPAQPTSTGLTPWLDSVIGRTD